MSRHISFLKVVLPSVMFGFYILGFLTYVIILFVKKMKKKKEAEKMEEVKQQEYFVSIV